jgi:hypothetical protein
VLRYGAESQHAECKHAERQSALPAATQIHPQIPRYNLEPILRS